jgi:hypothetical protein
MKFVTLTAMLGALVAIPFILGHRKPNVIPLPVRQGKNNRELETNLRYDVDDFLVEE